MEKSNNSTKTHKTRALSPAQIKELVKLLDVEFGIKPNVIFSRRAKRKACYTRRPVMRIHKNSTEEDVLHEFSHALASARAAAEAKPHAPAFRQAETDVLNAYTSDSDKLFPEKERVHV